MELFKDSSLLLATGPLFLLLIVAEILYSRLHDLHYHSVKGTLANVSLAAVNVSLDVLLRAVWFAVLAWVFQFRIARIENPWAYWILLLVLQDLLFYFLHRVDHGCRLFWAVHVTHHSSTEFNLTVGFRPSVLQPLYRFAWFLPLALLGFRPEDVLFIYSATQLYGGLVHTRCVGKLGFLEWFLCTPSHHRVHHACNPQYLDRNLGMVFIVWDRLFGTFTPETEVPRYGLKGYTPGNNPADALLHEWRAIGRDLRGAATFKQRWMFVLGPPGWGKERSLPGTEPLP